MAGHRALSAGALVLAVESATERAAVALLRGDEPLAERVTTAGAHHSETLLPAIDALLGEAGVALDDVAGVAVSIGPGSFTSLRVGLATVKGLCFGSERPVAAVPTLEALAAAALRRFAVAADEILVPVLDARRGEVFAAAYRASAGAGGALATVLEPRICDAAALAAALPAGGRLIGEAARIVGTELERIATGRFDSRDAARIEPGAVAVGRLGVARLRAGQGVEAETLVPVYVRRAEAEVRRAEAEVRRAEAEVRGAEAEAARAARLDTAGNLD